MESVFINMLTLQSIKANCQIDLQTQCWNWLNACSPRGYAVTSQYVSPRKSKNIRVGRATYELVYGVTPLLILHRCNNPQCVNPEHLYAGTHKDNSQDQKLAGTYTCGSRQGLAKLTEADIPVIRTSQLSAEALASQLGVTSVTINRVRRGETWQHVY